jgi:hypothetical protein
VLRGDHPGYWVVLRGIRCTHCPGLKFSSFKRAIYDNSGVKRACQTQCDSIKEEKYRLGIGVANGFSENIVCVRSSIDISSAPCGDQRLGTVYNVPSPSEFNRVVDYVRFFHCLGLISDELSVKFKRHIQYYQCQWLYRAQPMNESSNRKDDKNRNKHYLN